MLPVEIKEGWVTVVCLLLMFLCVAWAIQAAEWAEGLSVLQGTVALGGIVGILLAKSRTPSRLSHLLSLLAGWAWSAYLTARALGLALDLPGQMAVAELQVRLEDFFLSVLGGVGADNYVFVLLLAFSLWIMAYFGAWAVFRWQRVWFAVIVGAVALLLNINYAKENLTVYLILFLLAALLLIVRASLAFYQEEWQREHVGYSSELVGSFVQAGLVVSMIVILLAWVAPSALASRPLQPFWDRVSEPWRRLQDESARVFQDLNYQNAPPLLAMSDRHMTFGGPVNLTDTPVADVVASTGRYWRVLVFHEYAGTGWVSDDPDVMLVSANEQEIAFPEVELRREITQTVRAYQDLGPTEALIAAGQPLRADVPLRAAVSMIRQEEDVVRAPGASAFPPAPGDPSALYTRQPLKAGDAYRVVSSLTQADVASLRDAGIDYPEWVVPRYLQLPDSLPERVRSLAEQVTEGQVTPYDKAEAIETYLRQIIYNTQIEGPKPGQDGVDYFLFEEQQGYCDYYASAMVVMLRAVNVPARYVRGYSEGVRLEGAYHLLESDGHAWPEVYFPGYGWVEFEPTGSEPALNRPATAASADEQAPEREPWEQDRNLDEMIDTEIDPDVLAAQQDGGGLLPFDLSPAVVGGIAGIAALGFLGLVGFRLYRAREIDGFTAAERVYYDLVKWVRWLLRIEPLDHQTPNEYAGVVSANVPAGQRAVERIADYYVEERFGGKSVSDAYVDTAWQEAWPTLWRRSLERRLDAIRGAWRRRSRIRPGGET